MRPVEGSRIWSPTSGSLLAASMRSRPRASATKRSGLTSSLHATRGAQIRSAVVCYNLIRLPPLHIPSLWTRDNGETV